MSQEIFIFYAFGNPVPTTTSDSGGLGKGRKNDRFSILRARQPSGLPRNYGKDKKLKEETAAKKLVSYPDATSSHFPHF